MDQAISIERKIDSMKRFLTLALSLTLIFSLTACGGDGGKSGNGQNAAAPTVKANSKYVPSFKGCELPMNAEFAPLLDFLGEPESYFEAASCAFDGLDKTYTYAGLEIITYPNGDKDYVSSVRILDSTVSTPEGVTIGSTPEEVAAACGADFQEIGKQYVYADGDAELSVLFEDGKAISVEYMAINDLLG